jgi:hypothetical protein
MKYQSIIDAAKYKYNSSLTEEEILDHNKAANSFGHKIRSDWFHTQGIALFYKCLECNEILQILQGQRYLYCVGFEAAYIAPAKINKNAYCDRLRILA